MSSFARALEQARRDDADRQAAARARDASHQESEAEAPADPGARDPETATVERVAETPPPEAPLPVAPPAPRPASIPFPAPRRHAATSADGREPRRPAHPQAANESGEPVLWSGKDSLDTHLVSLITPHAGEAEEYRALRHSLEQFRQLKGVQVVAITSPTVGDGKTTTAINLAGALAQAAESRVLVIDADLRRPSVLARLGHDPGVGRGLVDALADSRLRLADIAQPVIGSNLFALGTGSRPASPYEVLRTPRLGELLARAREHFDYVIVDTPPMVPMQDGRLIAHRVDGLVLVVSAHRTPRQLLEETLDTIEPDKVLGIVFNRNDRPRSRYYSDHYRPDAGSQNGNGDVGEPRATSSRMHRAIERVRRGFRE